MKNHDAMKRMRREATEWSDVYAKDVSGEGLLSKTYTKDSRHSPVRK